MHISVGSSKAISDQAKTLRAQVEKVSKELEEEKSQLATLKQQLDLKERQLQRAKKGEEAKDTTEKEVCKRFYISYNNPYIVIAYVVR